MISSNQQNKQVWDLGVRLFHWSLVLFFTIAYLSGEDEGDIHIYSGYIVLGLLLFRIVWGVIGSQHARFNDFVTGPREIFSYAKAMINGTAKHYSGHNPLGGAMIVLLLLTLSLTTITGLKVYGVEGHGPLAAVNIPSIDIISTANASGAFEYEGEDDEEEFWEELHEFFANFMLVLIFLHIVGVIVSSRIEKENLVKAMITGYKNKN